MGRKARCFTPVPAVSLEELVPADHFYRHVERVLDLSYVRDLVQDCYAEGGRPSVDPVMFFKLQLVMFFEGVRSERLLMSLVADRLSVLWYLGYNLDEPLLDHSRLTRIRTRYGLDVFRRLFEAMNPDAWSRRWMGANTACRSSKALRRCRCSRKRTDGHPDSRRHPQ